MRAVRDFCRVVQLTRISNLAGPQDIRDLKPSSILVTVEANSRLLDLGVA